MAASIIVVGGGIGGLTTALSLHQAGFSVDVYESTDEIKALGVGVTLPTRWRGRF